jgi:chorismate mutase-like protein
MGYQMKTLQTYRQEIDALDDELIALLGRRYEIVRNVGHHKAQQDIHVVQSDRVVEVRTRAKQLARKHNLDPDFVVRLYDEMIDHAHTVENGIFQTQKKAGHGAG